MVATKNEIEDVTRIILQWLPETYAYDMMSEIWIVVLNIVIMNHYV